MVELHKCLLCDYYYISSDMEVFEWKSRGIIKRVKPENEGQCGLRWVCNKCIKELREDNEVTINDMEVFDIKNKRDNSP